MPATRLDEIDRKILAELQADGQIPSVGLLADAEAGEDPIEH